MTKQFIKYSLRALLVVVVLVLVNGTYWLLSDIQVKTYAKVLRGEELNLYEKCSVYSIHVGICTFGWFASPEATRMQCLMFFHRDEVWELHSRYFTRLYKDRQDGYIAFADYSIGHLRESLALNGTYKKGNRIFPRDYLFVYPKLKKPTYIGPFKFHEGLVRHLQDINWLSKPKLVWVL